MTTLIVLLIGYALGCFSTAYYLFRFSTGQDIRRHGSGNAGARNIGRELGTLAFVVTLVIDGGKGFLAIVAANHFQLDQVTVILTMIAVVAGHVWPVQLGFRGGKGVATGIGALAAFDAPLLIPSLVIFVIVAPIAKSFTLGGLLAVSASPIAAAIMRQGVPVTVGVALLAGLIIYAHRDDVREIFTVMPANSGNALDSPGDRRQP